MKIDILTLFPEMFPGVLDASILKRAQEKNLVEIQTHQLRDWSTDKHHTVDDHPYGGGPGMVLKVDVVDRALAELKEIRNQRLAIRKKPKPNLRSLISDRPYVILMTPQGKPLSQSIAQELAKKHHLILIAGHYEGFDERIRSLVDEEISIGDYVLTGGELPAMVIVDAVARLLPGVLGKDASSEEESFSLKSLLEIRNSSLQSPHRLLEYPQYTRPESYKPASTVHKQSLTVPEILKNGHHAEIAKWRHDQALKRTKTRRPDLLK